MIFDIKDKASLFSREKMIKYCDDNNINLIEEGYTDNMSYIEEDLLFAKVANYNSLPIYETGTIMEWYQNWQLIDKSHKVDTILFLDTETTTINGYTCSVALITLDLYTLEENKDFTVYYEVNPNEIIFKEAFDIHGLSQEYLNNKEGFESHYEDIMRIINFSELKCAFNGEFDIGIINNDFRRAKKDRMQNVYYLDPMKRLKSTIQAKGATNKLKNPTLEEACMFYKINAPDDGIFHNALYDTRMLKNVFLASINRKDKI